MAIFAALAIIALGTLYLIAPRTATQSFGLPLPEHGPNVAWWLRLKGSRDVVSGLVVLAVLIWGGSHMLGVVLLVEALVPLGDMGPVLATRGSTARALGVNGLTACDHDRRRSAAPFGGMLTPIAGRLRCDPRS